MKDESPHVRTRLKLGRGQLIAFIVLGSVLAMPWIIVNVIQAGAPFYRNYDPEILYFMNSLLPFKGQSYYYLDHPGTPIELIGSLLLALTYPFVTALKGNFILYYLQNPNTFLLIARLLLAACGIGCAIFVSRTWFGASRNPADLALGLAIPLTFFVVDPDAFASLAFWSHAAANFPFGLLLLALTYRWALRDRLPSLSDWALLGFLSGVLTSIMIYFAAWIIGLMIFALAWQSILRGSWLRTFSIWLTIAVGAGLGFGIMLLPAHRRIPWFEQWIGDLVSHQGIYGTGPTGITSVASMLGGAQQLFSSVPGLLVVSAAIVALYVGLAFWKRRTVDEGAGTRALGAGLVVQIIILILLAMKHPMDRYLLPVAATIPAAIMVILRMVPEPHLLRRGLTWVIIVSVLALTPVSLFRFATDQSAQVQYVDNVYRQEQAAIADYSQTTAAQQRSGVILWTYGVYSPCYALQLGNEYSWSAFTGELVGICPDQYQFNIWDQTARLGSRQRTLDRLNWSLLITSKSTLEQAPYLARSGNVMEYPYNVVVIQNTRGKPGPAIQPPSN